MKYANWATPTPNVVEEDIDLITGFIKRDGTCVHSLHFQKITNRPNMIDL